MKTVYDAINEILVTNKKRQLQNTFSTKPDHVYYIN